MKKIIVTLSLLIFSFIIIFSTMNKENLRNLKVQKITVYSVDFQKNDFYIVDYYKEILESKKIVKSIEDKEKIKKLKKIILRGKRHTFDYIINGLADPLPCVYIPPNTPNYVLKIEGHENKNMYMFLWLYEEQEKAFIANFETYNLKMISSDTMK